jgi:hypothetical protein
MSYPQFTELSVVSPAPRPFPGKYPTRIQIKSFRGSVPCSYTGKPVPELKEWLSRRYLRVGGDARNLTITEVDQNGIIRQLLGGGANQEAVFANMYFPLPSFYLDYLSTTGRTYLFLDRELKEVEGKKVYINQFWKGTGWEDVAKRMVRDLSRARFGRRYFTNDESATIAEFVDRKLVGRWIKPSLVPQPAVVRVATGGRQPRRREQVAAVPLRWASNLPTLPDAPQNPPPQPEVIVTETGRMPVPRNGGMPHIEYDRLYNRAWTMGNAPTTAAIDQMNATQEGNVWNQMGRAVNVTPGTNWTTTFTTNPL